MEDNTTQTLPNIPKSQTLGEDAPSRNNRKAKTTRKTASGNSRKQISDTERRLQAIQALTNLPEEGRFFLVCLGDEGEKVTTNWS